jgi:hypothetical protein
MLFVKIVDWIFNPATAGLRYSTHISQPPILLGVTNIYPPLAELKPCIYKYAYTLADGRINYNEQYLQFLVLRRS